MKSELKLKLQNQSIFANSGSGSYIETNSWCCGASLTAKQTLEIALYQQEVNQVFPSTLRSQEPPLVCSTIKQNKNNNPSQKKKTNQPKFVKLSCPFLVTYSKCIPSFLILFPIENTDPFSNTEKLVIASWLQLCDCTFLSVHTEVAKSIWIKKGQSDV